MKVLTIGDPHVKSDNRFQTDKLHESVENILKKHKDEIDMVVVLGDLLHRHEKIEMFPFMRAISFLRMIRKTIKPDADLVLLIGNHDRPNNKTFCTDEHVFSSLKDWENTIIVDTPIIKDCFLFVPYVPNGRFEEALGGSWKKFLEANKDLKCIFAHQEFRNASIHVTFKSTDGDLYPKDAPLCISGHIHTRHRPFKNVHYVGTPYEMSWVSDFNKKYYVDIYEFGENVGIENIEITNIPINFDLVFQSTDEFFSIYDNSYQNYKTRDFVYQDVDLLTFFFTEMNLINYTLISNINNIRFTIKCKDTPDYNNFIKTSTKQRETILKECQHCVKFNILTTDVTKKVIENRVDSDSDEKSQITNISFKDRVENHMVEKMLPDSLEFFRSIF